MPDWPNKLRSQEEFLRDFKLAKEQFNKTELQWSTLECIYEDYLGKRSDLEHCATVVMNVLKESPGLHSITHRLKHPERLIAKIIRRKLDNPQMMINEGTYEDEIFDLIGIRIQYLLKDDWQQIHDWINSKFEIRGKPIAYVVEGDPIQLYERKGCEVQRHKYYYRSIHYVIFQNLGRRRYHAEIQVETALEAAAWAEIDHTLRYPYNVDNVLLNTYSPILNKMVRLTEEMGAFMGGLAQETEKKMKLHLKAELDALARLPLEFMEKSRLHEGQTSGSPRIKASPYLLPGQRRRKYFNYRNVTGEGEEW